MTRSRKVYGLMIGVLVALASKNSPVKLSHEDRRGRVYVS